MNQQAGAEGGPPQVSTPYPKPPPFYKLYAKPDADAAGPAPPPPPPLPPAPPASGKFMLFGTEVDVNEATAAPLTAAAQLFDGGPGPSLSTPQIKRELSRLNNEAVFLFVELVRVLTECPGDQARLLTNINQVLVNMQHLVNCLRPRQAADTLQWQMQEQVDAKRKALDKVRAQAESVDRLLASAADALTAAAAAAAVAADGTTTTGITPDEAAGAGAMDTS